MKTNSKIKKDLQKMMRCFSKEGFAYKFLRAYGFSENELCHINPRSSSYKDYKGKCLFYPKFYFEELHHENLFDAIIEKQNELQNAYQYIVLSNFEELVAINTTNNSFLDCALMDLPQHSDFFKDLRK